MHIFCTRVCTSTPVCTNYLLYTLSVPITYTLPVDVTYTLVWPITTHYSGAYHINVAYNCAFLWSLPTRSLLIFPTNYCALYLHTTVQIIIVSVNVSIWTKTVYSNIHCPSNNEYNQIKIIYTKIIYTLSVVATYTLLQNTLAAYASDYTNKKLSYHSETARQLHMST